MKSAVLFIALITANACFAKEPVLSERLIGYPNETSLQLKWEVGANLPFIQEKIWPKLLFITDSDKNLKMPKMLFLIKDPQPPKVINGKKRWSAGRYYSKKLFGKERVEIYRLDIYSWLREFYDFHGYKFRSKECDVLLYMTATHELLHYLYNLKGVPLDVQHLKMYNDKSIHYISQIISEETNSSGIPEKAQIDSVKYYAEEEEAAP